MRPSLCANQTWDNPVRTTLVGIQMVASSAMVPATLLRSNAPTGTNPVPHTRTPAVRGPPDALTAMESARLRLRQPTRPATAPPAPAPPPATPVGKPVPIMVLNNAMVRALSARRAPPLIPPTTAPPAPSHPSRMRAVRLRRRAVLMTATIIAPVPDPLHPQMLLASQVPPLFLFPTVRFTLLTQAAIQSPLSARVPLISISPTTSSGPLMA